ncbi:MAG: DUF3971 domain-containing protein, partial [Roseobacter sp.]|nr:DUF3971 domain-containing protein [Roseobacter sp.]
MAPVWLKDRIAQQIEKVLPQSNIRFGDVVAVVDENWLPRFFVRDFEVLTPDGAPVLTLSNVSASLDKTALMEQRISLSALDADGVFVTLRRAAEGGFSISTGVDAGSVSRQAPTMAQLIGDLDDFFLTPALENLRDVDIRAITLRYEDVRAARAWTMDGGRVRISRDGASLQVSADLAILGGGAQVATLAANYTGSIGDTASQFGFTFENLDARDIASQSSAFGWLDAIRAPISGALRGGVDNDGGFVPLNATLQIGSGVIQPTRAARPIPINGASSYFTYLPASQTLRFDQFDIDSQWGRAGLEGAATMVTRKTGRLAQLIGQFRISNLSVNPADLYPEPVSLDSAELDFRLSLDPFTLQLGRLDVSDRGNMLTGQGMVSVGEGGWNLAFDGAMDKISAERIKALWPPAVKPKTRGWITENVFQGDVTDVSAAVRLTQGSEPVTYLSFGFSEADVRFLRDMPPVERARGHASLVKDRFVLVIDEGEVSAPQGGQVDVAGTSFIVPETKVKPDPPAVVRLRAAAPVTAALSLLDRPPLGIMQKASLPVDLATGGIEIDGVISMPLKKGAKLDEVTFDIAGTVRDTRSDRLVPGREIAADLLDLRVSDEEVRVSGNGAIDGVPVSVIWRQPIGAPGDSLPGQVTGQAEISPDALAAFGINLPSGMLQGQATAAFTLDMVKGTPPQLSLTSDLQGARLAIPQVQWSKPAGSSSDLSLSVRLGGTPRVDSLALSAAGLDARGSIDLTADQQLDRFSLSRVRLGDWLDARVDLVGRGAGRPVGVEILGGSVDLRRAEFSGASGSSGEGGPLSLALDRLQVSDTIAITDMTGDFTTAGGLSGAFSGAVNGRAAVSGQVTPRAGRTAIRVQGNDAGRVFAAAGLMAQAQGGSVDLELLPVGTGGAFDGKLRVEDTRITGAPAMAALLNSISVVGLVNELNGDGIRFS